MVHVEHGVGQFLGIREIAQGDTKGDYMLIEYAGGNKLYVPLSRMDLVQRFRGEGRSQTRPRQDGRRHLDPHQDAHQNQNARHGGGASQALRRAQAGPRLRLFRRQQLAARVRRRLRIQRDARSENRHRRYQARHGKPAADGSPALRRCRLRQDRSRDARRVQSHGRWQAGRGARAHHRAVLSSMPRRSRSAFSRSRCASKC